MKLVIATSLLAMSFSLAANTESPGSPEAAKTAQVTTTEQVINAKKK